MNSLASSSPTPSVPLSSSSSALSLPLLLSSAELLSTLSIITLNESTPTLPTLLPPFDATNSTFSRLLKGPSPGSPSSSSSSPNSASASVASSLSSSGYSRDENLAILEIITLSAIFVMIVFGNTSVLLALILSRIKLRRMYFFLLHLSIADLITAFANVLPQLIWEITEHFYGGNLLCKGIKYLQLLGPYLSSFTLCATAIDRYRAICYPLESRSRLNRSNLKVSIAWGLALICCLPQLFIFSYRQLPNNPGVYECWGTFIQPYGERLYVTWYALSSFFIPFLILIFTFSNICAELWRNGRRIKKAGLTRSSRHLSTSNGLPSQSKMMMMVVPSNNHMGSKNTGESLGIANKPPSTRLLSQQVSLDSITLDSLRVLNHNTVNHLIGNESTLQSSLSTLPSSPIKSESITFLGKLSLPFDRIKMRGQRRARYSFSNNSNNINLNTDTLDPYEQGTNEEISNGTLIKSGSLSSSSSPMIPMKTTNISTCQPATIIVPTSAPMVSPVNPIATTSLAPPASLSSNSTRRTSSSLNTDQCTPRSHSTAYFSKAKIKTIKLTVTIIICYICCSSPFNIVQIWAYWAPGAQESSLWRGSLITIAMLLPSLNSCVNPWIYLFFNRNLLTVLEKLCCSCSTKTTINPANRNKILEDSSVNVEAHGSSIKIHGSRAVFASQKMSKYSDDKTSGEAS